MLSLSLVIFYADTHVKSPLLLNLALAVLNLVRVKSASECFEAIDSNNPARSIARHVYGRRKINEV